MGCRPWAICSASTAISSYSWELRRKTPALPAPWAETMACGGLACQPAGSPVLSILWVIVVTILVAALGDNLGFWLGRRWARSRLERGRPLSLPDAKYTASRGGLFSALCALTVFFARFVVGLRGWPPWRQARPGCPGRSSRDRHAGEGSQRAVCMSLLGCTFAAKAGRSCTTGSGAEVLIVLGRLFPPGPPASPIFTGAFGASPGLLGSHAPLSGSARLAAHFCYHRPGGGRLLGQAACRAAARRSAGQSVDFRPTHSMVECRGGGRKLSRNASRHLRGDRNLVLGALGFPPTQAGSICGRGLPRGQRGPWRLRLAAAREHRAGQGPGLAFPELRRRARSRAAVYGMVGQVLRQQYPRHFRLIIALVLGMDRHDRVQRRLVARAVPDRSRGGVRRRRPGGVHRTLLAGGLRPGGAQTRPGRFAGP